MSGATVFLEFVAGEIGTRSFQEVFEYYFPSENTFEKEVQSSLDQINRKIDDIRQDTAYLRIQPVKDAFIAHTNYFKSELVPFLRLEMKSSSVNVHELKKHVEEVRQHRLSLGDNFDQGAQVFQERVQTCDFPVRTLFEILQNIAALRVVYLSWENFLYQMIPNAAKNNVQHIHDEYKKFKADAAAFLKNAIEPLCEARVKKIGFSQDIKMNLEGNPHHVKYDYHDTFSSQYPGDPFRGDEIHHTQDVTFGILDVLPLVKEKKMYELADAYDKCSKYNGEYQAHVNEVKRLYDVHVRVPANEFLNSFKSLPSELPTVLPEIKNLPVQ